MQRFQYFEQQKQQKQQQQKQQQMFSSPLVHAGSGIFFAGQPSSLILAPVAAPTNAKAMAEPVPVSEPVSEAEAETEAEAAETVEKYQALLLTDNLPVKVREQINTCLDTFTDYDEAERTLAKAKATLASETSHLQERVATAAATLEHQKELWNLQKQLVELILNKKK